MQQPSVAECVIHSEVYKQFVENESFKRFVGDMVYALTGDRWNCKG